MTNEALTMCQKIEKAMSAALARMGFRGLEVIMRTGDRYTLEGNLQTVEPAAAWLVQMGLMVPDGDTVADDELGLAWAYLRAR